MPRRTLWFFQRIGPGEIKRISNPSMQRFLVGERPLHQDGDGFVRCIGLSLDLHNKKPATVSRVWFSKIRVREDGKVDPHHRHETAKEATLTMAHQAESTVIVAGHRFAERRLSHLGEWRPEQRDLDALRNVVNTKAGKEML
ncbi:MAG TPA: hypothetical protein VH083_24130 [Myxococcales bacterium]|jgi:hypothetical protein|nr:hypothetical protein [Myxococcales bacterium]